MSYAKQLLDTYPRDFLGVPARQLGRSRDRHAQMRGTRPGQVLQRGPKKASSRQEPRPVSDAHSPGPCRGQRALSGDSARCATILSTSRRIAPLLARMKNQ